MQNACENRTVPARRDFEFAFLLPFTARKPDQNARFWCHQLYVCTPAQSSIGDYTHTFN